MPSHDPRKTPKKLELPPIAFYVVGHGVSAFIDGRYCRPTDLVLLDDTPIRIADLVQIFCQQPDIPERARAKGCAWLRANVPLAEIRDGVL